MFLKYCWFLFVLQGLADKNVGLKEGRETNVSLSYGS